MKMTFCQEYGWEIGISDMKVIESVFSEFYG
jgi:hypothetical protein